MPVAGLILTGVLIICLYGIVYTMLVCGFSETIQVTVRGEISTHTFEWGGIDVLFVLLGITVGWFSPIVVERRWDGSMFGIVLIASTWSLVASIVGLSCAHVCRGELPAGTLLMTILCLIGAGVGIAGWCIRESIGSAS